MITPTEVVVGLWVTVGVVLVSFVIERLMHVVLRLTISVATGGEARGTYAGMQIVGFVVSFWTALWASMAGFIISMVRALSWVFLWWLVLFIFAAMIFISYETMPNSVREMFMLWNTFLGPFLDQYIFWPLRLAQTITNQLLPLYNLVVLVYSIMVQSVFFAGLNQQPMSVVIGFGEAIGSLFGRLAQSITAYTFGMHEVVYHCAEMGEKCYQPVHLDLVPALQKIPEITTLVATFLKGFCPVVLFPFDILLYPLMDPNFLNAIDSGVHSLNLLLVETPRITAQRCKALGQGRERFMMCSPDIRPFFDETMKGMRQIGFGLDNWLDMSLVSLEAAGSGITVECNSVERIEAIRAYRGVFGSNMTSIVGVAPSLIAITDGVVIQWVDSERTTGDVLSGFGDGWPIEVDVSLGIASVSLPVGADARGEGSGLLGCRCDDWDDGDMHITCAVAPHFESSLSQQVFSVGFEVSSTARYMKCGASKISVQSVRWPATRYTSTVQDQRVGQNKVDAAIWVSPLCGTSGAVSPACLGGDSGVLFTQASCFPYCLALHERASVSQNLILFASYTWEDYVHLMARDCTMAALIRTGDAAKLDEYAASKRVKTFGRASVFGAKDTRVDADWDPESGEPWGGCVANPSTQSLIPRAAHGGYTASVTEGANSVRLQQQPFVFAGDLAVIGEYADESDVFSDEYSVTVVRIVGNSANEYTLRTVVGKAPANRPLEMHSKYAVGSECWNDEDHVDCLEDNREWDKDLLTLPFRFQTTAFAHNPGVQTSSAILFAVNPSLHMYTAMFEYCDPELERPFPRTQLSILSSYAPIQITRLVVGEASQTLAASSIRVPRSFTEAFDQNRGRFCEMRFNMAVSQMEYIDALNIGVTVINATISSARTLGEGTLYDLWYLNPETMEFRLEEEGLFSLPAAHVPSDAGVHLCPAMRRMPNLGSFVAEATVAVLFLVRHPLEMILGFIGMVPIWKDGVTCPLISHGHSQMERCGSELLSWDDFFRAVYNANRHAWRSFAFLAQFLVGVPGTEGVQNVMHGMNYFGAGMMQPLLARGTLKVVSFMNVPLVDKISTKAMKLIQMSPNALLGTGKSLVGSPIGVAWWVSIVVNGVIMDIIPAAVRGDVGGAFRSIFMNVYESQGSFKELVLADQHLACFGLSMMMGLNNPWAEMLLHLCQFPIHATQGVLDFTLTLFVDVAFTGCLCVQSSGGDFYEYARRECYTNAPKHLQPLIIRWLRFGDAAPGDVCRDMRTQMQSKIVHAMDPAWKSLAKAADSVGGSLDYLTVLFDEEAGQCLNFETDPYVVVILPEPVDYFRACSMTSLCEQRCGGEIAAFEKLLEEGSDVRGGYEEYDQEVQSKFFVGGGADREAPFEIVFSVKELTCVQLSDAADCQGRCVGVLGIKWGLGEASVRRYCVPTAPGQGVYILSEWILGGEGAEVGKWSLGRIVDDMAKTVVIVTVEDGGSGALRMASVEGGGTSALTYWTFANERLQGLRQVTEIYVHGAVMWMKVLLNNEGANELKRVYVSCASVALKECSMVQESGFSGDSSDFITVTAGHHVIFLGDDIQVPLSFSGARASVLLVPSQASTKKQDIVVLSLALTPTSTSVVTHSVIGYSKSFTVDAGVSGFYGMLFEQERYSENSVRFAQNAKDPFEGESYEVFSTESPGMIVSWLANVVIASTVSEKGSENRASVSRRHSQGAYIHVKVEKRCDKSSCAGCVALDVQRICYAMSQCMTSRCVGTMVNQRRPLCGIGGTLRELLAFNVEGARGLWSIGTETIGDILGLGFGDLDFNIGWPDDVFFSSMCVAKDGFATAISAVTSSVNNMAHTAMGVPIGFSKQGAQHVDPNVGIFMTMVLTSLNNLLFQISLGPMYFLIVLQKMIICQTNSVMAFTDVVGVSVTIGRADLQESDFIGECLPEKTATDIQDMQGRGAKTGIAGVAGALLTSAGNVMGNMATHSLTGSIDALTAYTVGVLTGVQDVTQTVDMAHCKMPDFFMRDVFKCVCGDTPVRIPVKRRSETAVDSAFWCSGTLSMLSPTGEQLLVYNGYSMQELSDKMESGNIDKYLLCLSRPEDFRAKYPFESVEPCERLRPEFSDLNMQGVETMAVWSRCKANYQVREWDPGAYAIFDNHPRVPYDVHTRTNKTIGDCLVTAHKRGGGNKACLQMHIQDYEGGMLQDVYFAYEKVPDGLRHLSAWIDACQVFTGPAARTITEEELDSTDVRRKFRACLDDYDDEGCEIPPFVWNARSTNRVPVATSHALVITDEKERHAIAQIMIDGAYAKVQSALENPAIKEYSNDEIEASLFSVEGDFLHQVFDCAVMGAFGKMDLWPSGPLESLPVPSWWRNEDGGRDIPVCGADENKPPFTCGSPTRKGIIKNFVRNVFQGEAATEATNELIRDKIKELADRWADKGSYKCQCPDDEDTHDFSCCDGTDLDSFLPPNLRPDFGSINSIAIGAKIVEEAQKYWFDMQTLIEPWWREVKDTDKKSWEWSDDPQNAETAANAGIYPGTGEVLWYNGSEVKGPFVSGTETLWEMCTGIIRKPLSSIPLYENASGTFFRDIDTIEPLSREADKAFVSILFDIAQTYSPVVGSGDWRHVPSQSAVCTSHAPSYLLGRAGSLKQKLKVSGISRMKADGNVLFPQQQTAGVLHGPEAFKLGAGDRDCMCGWYADDMDECFVPDALCNNTKMEGGEYCSRPDRIHGRGEDRALRVEIENAGLTDEDWQNIPCPMLAFSDHWGVIPQNRYNEWLTSGTTGDIEMDAEHVLAYGRGGLRLPAWGTLTNVSKAHIKPSHRRKRLYDTVTGEHLAGQRFCTSSDAGGPGDPGDADEGFLFPMGQIVQSSIPVEACSRYVVEALKYKIMTVDEPNLDTIYVMLQELSMQRWQTRCKSQVHLMSTCEHFGVFQVKPAGYLAPQDCPFTLTHETDADYITSGCLVYSATLDVFFDPCLCYSCKGVGTTVSMLFLKFEWKCRLRVDPRTLANGWADGVPQTFVDNLLANVLEDEDQLPEGPSSAMPPSEHCDGIIDWWPEEWSEPVGYHVTTPCHPSEAGYRVFDNSFAVHREVDGGPAQIRHHADALRDPVLKAANFGTCGLCRQTTYGMPLFDINPMRVCTQMSETEEFDPTVPRTPRGNGGRGWECAPSTHDVPWTPQKDPVGPELSAGTMPFFDPDDDAKWWDASELERVFSAGLSREDFPGFLSKPWCNENADCERITSGGSMRCSHNVCMDGVIACTRHSDCGEAGKMCSGEGQCTSSRISMHNFYSKEVEWQVTADDCGPPDQQGSFETLGVSPWGQISNVLDAHGFCSFQNWFGWSDLYDDEDKCPRRNSNRHDCILDFVLVERNYSWARPLETRDPTLHELGWLQVQPHACDMDYTRAGGGMHRGCYPDSCSSIDRAKWYKTFDAEIMEAKIALFALYQFKDTVFGDFPKDVGFLGLGLPRGERTWEDAKLVRCDSVAQCSSLAFTWDFDIVERQKFTNDADISERTLTDRFGRHTDTDTFKCSASMYLEGGRCKFDPLVVPFYDALCLPGIGESTVAVCNRRTRIIDTEALAIACRDVTQAYGVDEIPHMDTHVLHNSMFGVFNIVPENKNGYLDAVECTLELRAKTLKGPKKTMIKGATVQMTTPTSLYYAYKYSLYELPFIWWFRCSLLDGFRLSNLGSRTTWECKAWDEQYSTISFSDSQRPAKTSLSPFGFLQRIGGVYTLEDFNRISINEQDIEEIRTGIKKDLETTRAKRECYEAGTYTNDADLWQNQNCWNSDSAYSDACETVRKGYGTMKASRYDMDLVDILFDKAISVESDDSIFSGNDFDGFEYNDVTGEYEMRAANFDFHGFLGDSFLIDLVDDVYQRDSELCVKPGESFNDILLTYKYGYEDIIDDMGGLSAVEEEWMVLYDDIEDLTSGELMERLTSIVARQFDRTFYLGEIMCGGSKVPRVECSAMSTTNVCSMDWWNFGRSYDACLKAKVWCEHIYDPGTFIQLDDYVESSSRYENNIVSHLPLWGDEWVTPASGDEWACSNTKNLFDNDITFGDPDYVAGIAIYMLYCDTLQWTLTPMFDCVLDTYNCIDNYVQWVQNIFPWSSTLEDPIRNVVRDYSCSYKVLAEEDLWIQDFYKMELGKAYVNRAMCSGRTGCVIPTPYQIRVSSPAGSALRNFYLHQSQALIETGLQFIYKFIRWYALCILEGKDPQGLYDISFQYRRTCRLDTSSDIFPPSGWDWQTHFNKFDTSENIAHSKTLDTDIHANIRCKDEDTDAPTVKYPECGEYNGLLNKMKTFVSEYYREETFCKSDKDETRDFVGLDVSEQPVVFAWAATERENVHVEDLLDIDAQCLKGKITQSVCTLGQNSVTGRMDLKHINPWAGGDFNAVIGCDTTINEDRDQIYDSKCVNDKHCAAWNEHYPNQQCLGRDNTLVGQPRHTDGAGNNLCTQQAIPETYECTHTQGVLGGGGGVRVSSLYNASEFTCPAEGQSIFQRGGLGQRGCLQIRGDELGPVLVRMELGEDGNLRVTKVKLAQDVDIQDTLDLEEWVNTLHENSNLEDALYNATYGGSSGDGGGARTWSEPFQRIAFWAGEHAHAGRPLVPDPARSNILYKHLGLSQYGHPVQAAQPNGTWKGHKGFTKNGFCYAEYKSTAFSVFGKEGCDILDTMRVLLGDTDVQTSVYGGESIDVNDWPQTGGGLRDGSTIISRHGGDWRVLDRLPSFRVKYHVNEAPVTPGPFGKTTLSEGGDCHMGYGVSTRPETGDLTAGKCQLVQKTRSDMRFRCGGAQDKVLPRESSKKPREMVDGMRKERRKCSECSVPDYESSKFPMESEVSFGVPYRFSPVRRWMRAIQQALNGSGISDLDPTVKAHRKQFVKEHMQKVSSGQGVGPDTNGIASEFKKDWLFCQNVSQCSGSIPWEAWKPWDGRMATCFRAMEEQVTEADDFVVPIEMCNIDSKLDDVCSVLQEARLTIANGNCVASGECLLNPGFYSPAVFSVSNNDFVRVTVQNFYESYDENSCAVDRKTAENLLLRTQNERLLDACPSTVIEAIKQYVISLREMATLVAEIIVIVIQMTIKLLSLLLGSLTDALVNRVGREILELFLEMVELTVQMLEQLAKMFYKLIFEQTGLGRALEDMVNALCEALNMLMGIVKIVYCEFVKTLVEELVKFLVWIADFVENDFNKVCFGNCGMGDSMGFVREFASLIENYILSGMRSWCAGSGEVCQPLPKDLPEDLGSGALPFPTRCWAAYTPNAGMATQLSCTRSDTCAVDVLSTDKTVVCNGCPVQPLESGFQDYGCNIATKLCTCKTQYMYTTYCTNNEQCTGADASCQLVEDMFDSVSWGLEPCESCRTDAVCMYDGSQSLGKCVCPLQAPDFHRCAVGVSNINIAPTKKCLYTFSEVQGTGRGYMAFSSLSVVQCGILAEPQLCVVVDNRGGLVVGFKVVSSLSGIASGRRRLLELQGADFYGENASVAHDELSMLILDFGDWNTTADPCRSLVQAHRKMVPLGPVDLYVLRQCVFWRTVAHSSGLPDASLLSLQDFFACTSENFSLPLHVLGSLDSIFVNVLVAWPEARAAARFLRPLLENNSTWLGVFQARVLSEFGGLREQDQRSDATYVLRRLSMRSLKQVDSVGLTTGEVAMQGVDVRVELYGDIDMGEIDGVQRSIVTIDDIEGWGIDAAGVAYSVMQKLAIPEDKPFSVRSSEFIMGYSGANRGFSETSIFSSEGQSWEPPLVDEWDNFPPSFSYWVESKDRPGEVDGMSCPVMSIFLQEMRKSFVVLGRYYSEGYSRLPAQERTLSKTLPRWARPQQLAKIANVDKKVSGLALQAVKQMQAFISDFLGIDTFGVEALFSCTEDRSERNVCNFIKDMLSCNTEDIQLCSGDRRDLLMTMLLMGVLFLAAGWLMQRLGLTVAAIFVWLLYPSFVMWWAYRYSPACFPAVPVCLPEVSACPLRCFV